MSSSLLCVFGRIKYGLSVKSTQENHAERKLLMENLSEHLKENVTYINGLFENAMDYIEREFMVGTVPAALLTMDGLVSNVVVKKSRHEKYLF